MTGTLNGVYVIILKVCFFFCIIEKEPLGICSSNTNNDSSNQLCVYSNQDLKENWSLGSLSLDLNQICIYFYFQFEENSEQSKRQIFDDVLTILQNSIVFVEIYLLFIFFTDDL